MSIASTMQAGLAFYTPEKEYMFLGFNGIGKDLFSVIQDIVFHPVVKVDHDLSIISGDIAQPPSLFTGSNRPIMNTQNAIKPFADIINMFMLHKIEEMRRSTGGDIIVCAGLYLSDYYTIDLAERIGTKAVKDACFITRKCLPGRFYSFGDMEFSYEFNHDRMPRFDILRQESIIQKQSFESFNENSSFKMSQLPSDFIKGSIHRNDRDSYSFVFFSQPDSIANIDTFLYEKILSNPAAPDTRTFVYPARIGSISDLGGKALMRFKHYAIRIDRVHYPRTQANSSVLRKVYL